MNGSFYSTPHQARVAPSHAGSAPTTSNEALMNGSTKIGESLEKLAAGSGINTDLRTPVNTNSTRPTTAEADDEDIRSTPEAGATSIPVEASHNVGHEANHHISSPIELPGSAIYGLGDEVSKSTSLGRVPSNVEDAQGLTAGIANANGSVEHRQADPEHVQLIFETPIKLPSTDALNGDANCGLNALERDIPVTGTEEVPVHLHGRVCSECGEASEGSERLSRNVDEAEFMRCCTQILELYCPHTLKADMRTPNSYPLCCPLPRYPLPAGSTSSSRVCRSYVTQFTVDTLRAAHTTLTSTTQESTSEGVASVEQALSMAEQFLESKSRMKHKQGLIQEVEAASVQASRDFKAYGDLGASYALASRLIPRLLTGEKQHMEKKAKNDVQLMGTFLKDINKLLTSCFQYVGKVVEASLLSVDDNHATSNALFALDSDNKPGLEAVRIAVPLWLRMYHDVAHSSGLLK